MQNAECRMQNEELSYAERIFAEEPEAGPAGE